jgi:hypothetical protein
MRLRCGFTGWPDWVVLRLRASQPLVSTAPGTLAGLVRTKALAADLAWTWSQGRFASATETFRVHFEVLEEDRRKKRRKDFSMNGKKTKWKKIHFQIGGFPPISDRR